VTWTPRCFLDNTAPPFQIQLGFRVTLGPAPSAYANGIYWVSVYVHGKKIDLPNMTPGQSIDYSVAVQAGLGDPILIRANAYLPIKRLQSNDQHTFNFPKMCPPMPITVTISDYRPSVGDDFSGQAFSRYFNKAILSEYRYEVWVIAGATIDNVGSVAGVGINNGLGDPYYTLSVLEQDTKGSASPVIEGENARFIIPYNVSNWSHPPWFNNPSAISATVEIRWFELP
jgi:hypothetical protein